MNAALLLVTTAWLAGADQPAPPAATVAPPAATSSCCGDCGGGCGHGFLERLRELFHHDCCETSCKPTCAQECKPKCVQECKPKCVQECKPKCVQECKPRCAHECKPACEKSCCDSCRPRLLDRLRDLFHRDCCDSGCRGGCGSSCDTCRRGLFSRLRDWFQSRHCCHDTCCNGATATPGTTVVPGGEPIAPPKDAPKKMPSPAPGKEVRIIEPAPSLAPTANVTVETETKSPFELNRRYVSRVDRASDYSWLTGQLFYVHADGGLWVLRYAPLWKEDPNGGSMVLARDLRMDSYHEGDLVTIHGEIISRHGSEFLGGPLYQVHSIKLVERAGE